MKKLILLIIIISGNIFAQQTVVVAYGSIAQGATTGNRMTIIAGQSMVGDGEATDFSYSSSLGFWGILKLPPLSPFVYAADGDFSNRVEITWELDPLSPPAKSGYKLLRNSSLISEINATADAYQDYNVIAGDYYEYELIGINEYGEGASGLDVGFMNPNGVITGQVLTSEGSASVGTEVYLSPQLGKSLKFNGDGEVIIPEGDRDSTYFKDVLGISDELTIEMWFYSDGSASQQMIFFSGDRASAGGLYSYIDLVSDGRIKIRLLQENIYTPGDSFTPETWHHLAITAKSNTISTYVDGNLVDSYEHSVSLLEGELWRFVYGDIIFGHYSNVSPSLFLNGKLDDIRIWNTARTEDQIQTNMNRSVDNDDDGLVAYWKFDEGNGDWVFDQTKNDWDGSIDKAEWSNETADIQTSAFSDDDGNFLMQGIYYGSGETFSVIPKKTTTLGSSLFFDGDDLIEFDADSLLLIDNSFTIEEWFYVDEITASTLFEISNSEGDLITLNLTSDGMIKAFFEPEDGTYLGSLQTTSAVAEDEWYQITLKYDGTTGRLILSDRDGGTIEELSLSTTGSGKIGNSSKRAIDPEIIIGENFKGYIDEVYYWASSRSDDNIALDMAGTSIVPASDGSYDTGTDSLLAYWKFNENIGSFVSDLSYNGLNGTISDTAMWNKDEIPLEENFLHTFSPGSRYVTLNVSNTSNDNVIFNDVSLINVSGYVRYENTSCYADSVQIFVDGESTSPETYTDKNGKFILELEPGSTANINPDYGDFAFSPTSQQIQNLTAPVAGMVFDISTTRSFSGYIAGGNCLLPIMDVDDGENVSLRMESQDGCYEATESVNSSGKFNFSSLPPLEYFAYVEHDNPEIQEYFDLRGGVPVSLRDSSTTLDFLYYSELQTSITFPNASTSCDIPIFDQGDSVTVNVEVFEDYYSQQCATDSGTITIKNYIGNTEDLTISFIDGFAEFKIFVGQPNLLSGGDYPYQKQLQITAKDTVDRIATESAWAYVNGIKQGENTFTTVTPEIPTMIIRDPPGDKSYAYVKEGHTTSTNIRISAGLGAGFDYSFLIGSKVGFSIGMGFADQSEFYAMSGPVSNGDLTYKTDEITINTTTTSELFKTNDIEGLSRNGGDVFIGAAFVLRYGEGISLAVTTDELGNCDIALDTILTIIPDTIATSFIYTENHIRESIIPSLEYLKNADSLIGSDGSEIPQDTSYYNAQLEVWESFLGLNDSLKEEASFVENISLDAGSIYEYTKTIDSTNTTAETTSITYVLGWKQKTGFGAKAGAEIELKGFVKETLDYGSSDTYNESKTFGYHFEDNDKDDFYSINVKRDDYFDTYVFEVVSGQSQCPWEPGTRPRYGVQLSLDQYETEPVPTDEPAVFSVYLGNTSQSGEDKTYALKVLQESNSNGATISVNGVKIEDHLSFKVPAGQQMEGIMTVEKGPGSYTADTLQIKFYSECEAYTSIPDEYAESIVFSETATFIVNYAEPCSKVSISSPGDDWLITSDDNNELAITISDYEKDNSDLEEIRLQFRKKIILTPTKMLEKPGDKFTLLTENADLSETVPSKLSAGKIVRDKTSLKKSKQSEYLVNEKNSKLAKKLQLNNKMISSSSTVSEASNKKGKYSTTSNDWVTFHTIPRDSLPATTSYLIYPWNISDLIPNSQDGLYEIRAVAFCETSEYFGVSEILTGLIDRTPPVLVGDPKPFDKVLGMDDEISFTFDENIDCSKIDPLQDVLFVDTETGESLNYEYTCTENKIVFKPIDQNIFLENKILKATVANIYDQYGNGDTDTSYSWEFFVDRNPIGWDGGDIDLAKLDDEEKSVIRKINNEGGQAYSYEIKDVADWLSVSPIEGIVQPKSAVTLTFEVGSDLSHGVYVDTIYAESVEGIETLIVTVEVICNPPAWEIQPQQFEHSMVIVANLEVVDEISEDLCDVMYAFVGDELRGVASLQYFPGIDSAYTDVNPYQVFMTVYSDVTDGEVIVLRVWDSSEKQIVTQLGNYYDFVSNDIIGSPTEPDTVQTSSLVLQETFMVEGWNWFSTNLTNTDMSIDYVLSSLSPDTSTIIKNNSIFSEHSLGYWAGSISELTDTSMYMIKLNNNDTLQYFGEAIDLESNSFIINEGWNWIGYQPTTALEINEALVSLSPDSGDVIKSQRYFSTYLEDIGWIGSLVQLEPQNGYKIKSAGKDTLIYSEPSNQALIDSTLVMDQSVSSNSKEMTIIPKSKLVEKAKNYTVQNQSSGANNKKNVILKEHNVKIYPKEWIVNPNDFEFNMNIVGVLDEAFNDSIGTDDLVGAFVNGECRGVASPLHIQSLDKELFFLTVFSNSTAGDTVRFAVLKYSEKQRIELEEQTQFLVNNVLGSASEPFLWSLYITGIWDDGFIPENYSLSQNYPNPFNPSTQIEYGLPYNSRVTIKVFDILGQKVATLIDEEKSKGYYKLIWNSRNDYNQQLASGVYLYRIVAKSKSDTFIETKKLILLK